MGDDTDGDDEEWEETAYFIGPCTCEHEDQQHGWGSCGVDDCPCEAGWEE